MTKARARLVTFLFMAMFLAILTFISIMRPGALVIFAYIFAVLGVIYFARLLFGWLMCDGQ